MTRHSAAGAGLAAAIAIAALFGCAATDEIEGTWGTGGEGQPQLILTGSGGVTGTDGCNQLVSSWSEKNQVLVFSDFVSTAMYCEGVDTWLSGIATAKVDGKTLTVFDGTGAEIGTLARQD